MMLPNDPNWQMTVLFLLALALLGFVMKLIALLRPAAAQAARSPMAWILPSPNSVGRSQPTASIPRVFLRTLMLLGAVLLISSVYWQFVQAFQIRGIFLSYLAVPILLLVTEFLVAGVGLIFLQSGRSLPALHYYPWSARGVADFWGNRWNLWFSDWFRYAIFPRLRRHPIGALFLVFAVSGLMHEWVINVPLYCVTGRVLFGSMMFYFLVQAGGIQLERRFLKGHPRLMMAFVWLVVFLPSPLVLNEGLLRTLHLWPEHEIVTQRFAAINMHNTGEVLFRLCANTEPM